MDPPGPIFLTKLGYVETVIFENLGFPFESKENTIRTHLIVDLGYYRRSSLNVNLTDLLPKLASNKHDFVSASGFRKAHLGRQGSIQTDLVSQAISSARMLFLTTWTSWKVIWSHSGRSIAIWSGTRLDRWIVVVAISGTSEAHLSRQASVHSDLDTCCKFSKSNNIMRKMTFDDRGRSKAILTNQPKWQSCPKGDLDRFKKVILLGRDRPKW